MRWRQVVVLWAVCGVLGAEYWFVERHAAPPEPSRPERARFLRVDAGDVREIRLVRGGRQVVSRRAGDRWQVVEPSDAAVPSDLIAAFANALTGAEEIDVLPGGGDARAFGLDEAAARVELVVGTGAPVVVTLGGPNATGTAVYARSGNAPSVVLIGRNVRYYEDLIFEALPPPRAPVVESDDAVGG